MRTLTGKGILNLKNSNEATDYIFVESLSKSQ